MESSGEIRTSAFSNDKMNLGEDEIIFKQGKKTSEENKFHGWKK